MTGSDPERLFGAALGASAAPAAMCGVSWSALGMSGPLMWLLAIVAGGLLGGLTWSQFSSDRGVNVGFSVLFGASAGLVAGALVGGPVGGVFGLCGGASAGLAAPLVFRALGERPGWMRAAGSWMVGSTVAGVVGWGMTL